MAGVNPLHACLLQWVQSFDNASHVRRLLELNDGSQLWNILSVIDEDYFNGQLPDSQITASSDWTRKWQNLKYIEKQVQLYYLEICEGQEQVSAASVPDLKIIAAGDLGVDDEVSKLLMVIIHAAMASPTSNQRMVGSLMGLGRENAKCIADGLRAMEEEEDEISEPVSRDEMEKPSEQELATPKANGVNARAAAYQDPLLEREEQLLQAQATIDKLHSSQLHAKRQIEDLRLEKEKLEVAFDAYRNQIDNKGRKHVRDGMFQKLQRQVENDRAYIEDLETQLQTSRSATEDREHQLQRQKMDKEAGQNLRDELQLLKADNDELKQKNRANDNLRKKIQTLQDQEKANATLRDDVKQAHERLDDMARLKRVQAGLEKEIIEKQGLIRNQEYQINELGTMRKNAEHNSRVLEQKLKEARERHDRDHEMILDLRGQEPDTTQMELDDSTSAVPASEPRIVPNRSTSSAQSADDTKHLSEKLALLQQQLETADLRLRQAFERNAAFEEQQHTASNDLQNLAKELADREQANEKLREQLDTASKQPRTEAPKQPQDVAALQRENHLMATAWYDLSSRLQTNGVSLSRRRQEPKSWIAKQRLLVGPNVTSLG